MLDDNRIRSLGDNLFSGTNVTFIDISGNELTEYRPSWFNGIEFQVETLLLSFNRFPVFPAFAFELFENLRELDLSRNPITSLYQNLFFGLGNLRRLFLNAIGATTINHLWFLPLTSIEHIYMSNNQIRDIPDNSFDDLPGLLTVTIENNDLTFIRASAFGSSITNIRNLFLSYNRIQAIEQELLDSAESLLMLGLGQNECLDRNFYNVPGEREEINVAMQQCFTNFIGSARCQFLDFGDYPYECLLFINNPVGHDFERIDGNHTSGRNNSDVLVVEALYQNTRNFPNVICR